MGRLSGGVGGKAGGGASKSRGAVWPRAEEGQGGSRRGEGARRVKTVGLPPGHFYSQGLTPVSVVPILALLRRPCQVETIVKRRPLPVRRCRRRLRCCLLLAACRLPPPLRMPVIVLAFWAAFHPQTKGEALITLRNALFVDHEDCPVEVPAPCQCRAVPGPQQCPLPGPIPPGSAM